MDQLNGVLGTQNTTGYTQNAASGETAELNGELFASMLKASMNSSLASVADFSDAGSESSFLGSQGAFDSSGLITMMLLSGLGGQSGSSGLGSLFGGGEGASPLMGVLLMSMMGGEAGSLMLMSYLSAMGGKLFSGGTQGESTQAQNSYITGTREATGIPADAWKTANPPLSSDVSNRSASLYRQVIDQFDVENNPRYAINKRGVGDTYCNIFAWDVTRAMGAELPHYTDPATGAPVAEGTKGAKSMMANSMCDWLNTYGPQYGWKKVSAQEAQAYANAGHPAVTGWKNPGGHGHMQIVSPSANGAYDEKRGTAIAQAGSELMNYGYITDTYGAKTLGEVEYFVHL